jgi:peptide subunit release factor 1 (eRF1)
MIPTEELHQLADHWSESGDAVSLYLCPGTPSELAHREEPILAKEQIQQVFGSISGHKPAVRSDIARMLEVAAAMKGNHGQAKVIFACKRENIWHEYDLPPMVPTYLGAGPSFALAPLAGILQKPKRYLIALADRNRARVLLLENGQISERTQQLKEERDHDADKIRTTGTGGSRSIERQREELARQHFEFLSSQLHHALVRREFDALLIGCRDAMWPEIESQLHSDLRRALLGRFGIDPGLASAEEVREGAQGVIEQADRCETLNLLEAATAGAEGNGRGVRGLPGVLRALEQGEVRTILWQPRPNEPGQPACVCTNCKHIRPGAIENCDLCGQPTHRFLRAEEALIRSVLGRGPNHAIELRLISRDKAPLTDEFSAVLRFRAEHNTAQALAS